MDDSYLIEQIRQPGAAYPEMELALLGGMIRHPETVGAIVAEATAKIMTSQGTAGVFLALRNLHLQGDPIDVLSVEHEAGSDYHPIIEAAMAAPDHPAAMPYWAKALRDAAQMREIKAVAAAVDSCEDVAEVSALVDTMQQLTCEREGLRITSVGDAAAAYMDKVQRGEKPAFIRTGLRIFDDEVALRKGKFFVIGGFASSGKTALTLQIARHMARTLRVGYFSLETDDEDIAVRSLTEISAVQNRKVLRHDLNEADKAALAAAAESLRYLSMDVIQASGLTVADIRATALARRYDAIFVDYLQYVRPQNARATLYEQVTQISQDLHTLAQRSGILVVALSQLSRPETTKGGKQLPPTMSDLRQSGQIEQDADAIALLYPEDPKDYKSNRILKVAKNKDGEKLELDLKFEGWIQRFSVIGRRREGQKAVLPGSVPEGFVPASPEMEQETLPF